MVWTDTTRIRYDRIGGRYSSDCNDEEWALIESFMPCRRPTGRPRTTNLRDVWDAIQYMASTGCQWSMIPNDFPPPSTVQRYFYDWRDGGLFHRINHALVMDARELEGREASPSAGVIDSQSVKVAAFQKSQLTLCAFQVVKAVQNDAIKQPYRIPIWPVQQQPFKRSSSLLQASACHFLSGIIQIQLDIVRRGQNLFVGDLGKCRFCR